MFDAAAVALKEQWDLAVLQQDERLMPDTISIYSASRIPGLRDALLAGGYVASGSNWVRGGGGSNRSRENTETPGRPGFGQVKSRTTGKDRDLRNFYRRLAAGVANPWKNPKSKRALRNEAQEREFAQQSEQDARLMNFGVVNLQWRI